MIGGGWLVVGLLGAILFAKKLAAGVAGGLAALGAPPAAAGVFLAMLVLLPEVGIAGCGEHWLPWTRQSVSVRWSTWKSASQRWNRKFGPEVSRRALTRDRSPAKAFNCAWT
jgi:hypothetical protein